MAEYLGGNRINQDTLTTLCRSSSTELGDYLQQTRPFALPFVIIFRSSKWPWQYALLTHTGSTFGRFSIVLIDCFVYLLSPCRQYVWTGYDLFHRLPILFDAILCIPYRADEQLLHNPRTIKSQFPTRSFRK